MSSCWYNSKILIKDPEYKKMRPRQVNCDDLKKNCQSCGWNPNVERERKARMMVKVSKDNDYQKRFRQYEIEKQKLIKMNLNPRDYEEWIKILAEKYKI